MFWVDPSLGDFNIPVLRCLKRADYLGNIFWINQTFAMKVDEGFLDLAFVDVLPKILLFYVVYVILYNILNISYKKKYVWI